jgi:ribose-phosphate pyrophosphokinase
MSNDEIAIFAMDGTRAFGEQVAAHLGLELSPHQVRTFEDGEHTFRSLVNVRSRDVFVIHSIYSDETQSVNDKLMRLLHFIGALHDSAAARVTAVVPYLAFMRADTKSLPRGLVTTRHLATLFEASGADRILTIDVHSRAAFDNAFRIGSDHLEARPIFARHFAATLDKDGPVVVISPDAGGLKRAGRFRDRLAQELGREVGTGFMEKTRTAEGVRSGGLHADVDGATVIVVDDMISTGGTLALAASSAKDAGAGRVAAAATHGLFVGDAPRILETSVLDEIVITDTIPPFRIEGEAVLQKVTVLSTTSLFAAAIQRIHDGGSVTELLAE